MKRIVKTEPELLNTKGVRQAKRGYEIDNGYSIFVYEMRHLCGRELKAEADLRGRVVQDGWQFDSWMYKEIIEPSPLKAWEYVNKPNKDRESNVAKIRSEYSF